MAIIRRILDLRRILRTAITPRDQRETERTLRDAVHEPAPDGFAERTMERIRQMKTPESE